MNEELKKVFLDFISMLKDAKGFVLEQAPDVLQQLVMAERAFLSFIAAVLFVALFISKRVFDVGYDIHKKNAISEEPKYLLTDPTGYFIISFFCGLCVVGFLVLASRAFFTAWFAPKVYLLNYFMELLK